MAVGTGVLTVLEREPDQPIHRWVYKVLRGAIIETHIQPAQALSEKEIAALLGVSRTPVREAFIRLAEDGLLVITPQKRSVVTPIDLGQAEEARFVRRALEKAVMKEVCGRLVAADRAELAAAIDAQVQCRRSRSYDGMLVADNDFHRIIFRAAGKEQSWRYIKKLDYNYDRLRIIAMPRVIDHVIDDHRRIVQLLVCGDQGRVEDTVDAHLSSTAINDAVREYPAQYFVHPAAAPAADAIGASRRDGAQRIHPAGKEAVARLAHASRPGSKPVRRRKS